MGELIRLELGPDPEIELRNVFAQDRTARERRLYAALLAIASLNVFLIFGALSFLWLAFRN